MTIVGQVFVVTMVVLALMQPIAGPQAFTTDEALDLPLCEKINDTVRLLLTFENKHTLENFLQDKARKPLSTWNNSYTNQH